MSGVANEIAINWDSSAVNFVSITGTVTDTFNGKGYVIGERIYVRFSII